MQLPRLASLFTELIFVFKSVLAVLTEATLGKERPAGTPDHMRAMCPSHSGPRVMVLLLVRSPCGACGNPDAQATPVADWITISGWAQEILRNSRG